MPEPRKPFSFPAASDGEAQMRDERQQAYDRDAYAAWDAMGGDRARPQGEFVDGDYRVPSESERQARLRAIHGGLPDAVDAGAPTKIPATFKG